MNVACAVKSVLFPGFCTLPIFMTGMPCRVRRLMIFALSAGKCGVQLEKRMQSAPSSSQESSLRHGWAPEWMSAMAAEERLVRYNMDEAPLMRAVLVQQVSLSSFQPDVAPELLKLLT